MNGASSTAVIEAVRQRHIDALQRRAVLHQGETRRVIECRLQQLRAGMPKPSAVASPAPPAPAAPATGAGALQALLVYIGQHTSPTGELKAVHDYRGTWARLGMEQRLQQTLNQVPDNAGPLNTQRLLHAALQVMRDTSPAYLQHFMQHVDGLLALSQISTASAQTPALKKPAAR